MVRRAKQPARRTSKPGPGQRSERTSRDRDRLLEFFLAHPDVAHENATLARMLGDRTDSWTRRLRELREPRFGGYKILTHRDRDDLRPGQYIFPAQERRKASNVPRLSGRVRTEVLFRDAYTCQACGLARGQRYEDGRLVSVHVHHDLAHSHGGPATVENCFTLCSRCNEGESNIGPDRPTVDKVMSIVRVQPRARQRAIYEFLRSVFDR
jgi:hypothetical protein